MLTKKSGKLSFITGHWPLREELPTLIFLHSSGCDARLWLEQVAGLTDVANTIALDLPGHGGSEGPILNHMPDFAALVADFIQENHIPHPIPCGLSLGSAIVLQLLLDHPDSVEAGILMGSGARLRVLPSIFETLKNDYAGLIKMLETLSFAPQAKEETIQMISQIMLSCAPEATEADFRACDNFDVMSRLPEIKHPVLIIAGELDKLTPPKYARYLEEHLPQSTLVLLAETGHMLPNERPGQVNEAIRKFLQER